MTYDIAGKVKLVGDVNTFGTSGFRKRELVVTVPDGKYPQDISIEFHNDKESLLNGVSEGDEVKVTYDLRGKESKGRHWNTLVGWKLDVVGGAAEKAAEAPVSEEEDDDDIPF